MISMLVLLTVDPALAGAKVSAFQKDSKMGSNYWSGAAAIDGKMETAWQVPGESPNRGEWIELDVPKGDIDKLSIMPGFAKNEESFGDYPRVKKLRIDAYDVDDDQNQKLVGSATVDVADKMETQIIDFPDIKVGQAGLFGGKVKISVVDIYEGRDFPNLAISELALVLKEMDAGSAKLTEGGTGIEALSDADVKTNATLAVGTEYGIARGGYGVSSVGFIPASKDGARPKTVEVMVGNQDVKTVLPDVQGGQWLNLPNFNGYNGGAFDDFTIKIIDTYPGTKSQDMVMSEVKFKASCLESL